MFVCNGVFADADTTCSAGFAISDTPFTTTVVLRKAAEDAGLRDVANLDASLACGVHIRRAQNFQAGTLLGEVGQVFD